MSNTDDSRPRNLNRVQAFPNRTASSHPVRFDPSVCNGCNRCVNVCQADVMIPNPGKGQPPIVLYPEECWYEGSCVEHCPRAGAIRLNHPLAMRVRWKRKATGRTFRV
jgi:NAD-dependent dihydropyrimidine dehydrogenase PreA subunit